MMLPKGEPTVPELLQFYWDSLSDEEKTRRYREAERILWEASGLKWPPEDDAE